MIQNAIRVSAAQLFILIPAFVGMVYILAPIIDRDPPVSIVRPAEVTGGDFSPGGWVTLSTRLRRDRLCDARGTRAFVDAQGFRFAIPDAAPPRAYFMGERDITISVPIPQGAAAGVGRFTLSFSYGCWPGQLRLLPIVVNMADVPVTVVR
jgi:hypothetical protein